MRQSKNIHLISPVQDLMERLSVIKFTPRIILSESIEQAIIKKIFPEAEFLNGVRADLILEVCEYLSNIDLSELLEKWRKQIKPDGVLLCAFTNLEVDIVMLGDYLFSLGFVDVVVDNEEGCVYIYAVAPKEVSVNVSQIRRVN